MLEGEDYGRVIDIHFNCIDSHKENIVVDNLKQDGLVLSHLNLKLETSLNIYRLLEQNRILPFSLFDLLPKFFLDSKSSIERKTQWRKKMYFTFKNNMISLRVSSVGKLSLLIRLSGQAGYSDINYKLCISLFL